MQQLKDIIFQNLLNDLVYNVVLGTCFRPFAY